MFLNSDDIPKLPESLIISLKKPQFRIFFTDDRIICFTYKAVGHTTIACKKVNLTNNSQTLDSTNIINIINNITKENSVLVKNHPSLKTLNIDEIILKTISDWCENTNIQNLKRQASLTNKLSSPISLNTISVNKQANLINKLSKPPKK